MAEYFATSSNLEFACGARVVQNFPPHYSEYFEQVLYVVITRLSKLNLPIFVLLSEPQREEWKDYLYKYGFIPIYYYPNTIHNTITTLFVREPTNGK